MLNILRAPAVRPNPDFVYRPRGAGQGNAAWLAQYANGGDGASTPVVLVGGVDPVAFRLRIAQAHARDTFDPSTWSHAFICAPPPFKPGTRIWEIPLTGIRGFPPQTNGLQISTLRAYDDPEAYPNVALLVIPVPWREVQERLELFATQRAVLDALDLMVRWLAFVWGAGRAGNPLLDGFGIPGAAMIEVVMSAAGLDMTPNVPNRASYPEAIWQTAKWWQDHQQERQQLRITGAWTNEHRFGSPGPRKAASPSALREKKTRNS